MLEIMTMIERLTFVVITKYDSPCLPYVDVIRMLQSLYGCDNKKGKPETETGAWNCSVKKAFLKITQSSEKTTCPELLFKKVADLQIAALFKGGSSTGGSQLILQNFYAHPFCKILADDCFFTES